MKTIKIYLTDDEFLKLAKAAHKLDLTFNSYCSKLLEDYIRKIENNT
jgi:hypothetical protein